MIKPIKNVIYTTLLASFFATSPIHAKTFDGVIKGAECHLYGKFCSDNQSDIKPYFEKDFVLVTGDQYYLLDFLPLNEKLHLNNQTVRILGDLDQQRISVTSVDSLKNGEYMNIWNWEDYQFEYYGI